MSQLARIVVTGVGLVTPLSPCTAGTWQRLMLGESGIRPSVPLAGSNGRCRPGAAVDDFDLAGRLRFPKHQKYMNRGLRCGMEAARQAVQSSGVDLSSIDPYRIGAYVGSGQTELESCQFFRALEFAAGGGDELDLKNLGGRASRLIDPYVSLTSLSNAGVFFLSSEFYAQGPSHNFVQDETASALAVAAAIRDLRLGRCDLALAGGYDSLLHVSSYLAYRSAGLLCEDAQGHSFPPFHSNRQGLVLGEGAGFMVLERLPDARQRGACPLGELLGVGFAMDCSDKANPEGSQTALQSAVRQAAGNRRFDCIIARGIGTAQADRQEAEAIAALNANDVPVTAFKGQTGYLGAAAASVDLAIGLLSQRERLILPIAGLCEPDRDLSGLDFVTAEPRQMQGVSPSTLALSRGWTGQCAAVLAAAVRGD